MTTAMVMTVMEMDTATDMTTTETGTAMAMITTAITGTVMAGAGDRAVDMMVTAGTMAITSA
jgi:hypothetical protein